MILTDSRILKAIEDKEILIKPFDARCLGSNSYDVHLGDTLGIYIDEELDCKKHNKINLYTIPPEGFVLQPNQLYLGVTHEYTECHNYVPFLEGKSSIGRLGIDIHATAGKGDVGYCNTWTLEISVIKPVRVYARMPIGQLIFFVIDGKVSTLYNLKKNAKYSGVSTMPMESMMFKNF